MKNFVKVSSFVAAVLCPQLCLAVGSAELYSSKAYGYGRYEARLRFAAGDGVVSAFFLWKDGSEKAGTFWNELDFEKVGPECRVQSNAIYGNPNANHNTQHMLQSDLCGAYHTYTYEWTPEAVVWLVDGVQIRKDVGATPQAFAENASTLGMQFHFNLWPGDSTFGGVLNPSILPVHQYIDWVQFSAYENGAFTLSFREDFNAATLPEGWLTGSWASPKNKSTHAPENVNFINGYAVLSLTADTALGATGAMPGPATGGAGASGVAGAAGGGAVIGGAGTTSSSGGAGSLGTSGAPAVGGSSNLGGATAVNPGSSGSPSSVPGAGASTAGGAAVPTAGAANGAAALDSEGHCSFGPSPTRGTSWWLALAVPALALLRRRSARGRAL